MTPLGWLGRKISTQTNYFFIKAYVGGTHVDAIQMSTCNICFYKENHTNSHKNSVLASFDKSITDSVLSVPLVYM